MFREVVHGMHHHRDPAPPQSRKSIPQDRQMSVDYMRPNFFEDSIQRLKQSRVETGSLAEIP